MKAYSTDLREKVVAAVARGVPRATVAETFGISPATVKRWLRQHRTGSLAPRPIPGRPATLGVALDAALPAQVQAAPDATIAEHCATWEATTGQAVGWSTMRRAIVRSAGWRWNPRSFTPPRSKHRMPNSST